MAVVEAKDAAVHADATDTAGVPRVVTHLSVDESKAKGKRARDTAPRDSHAIFESRADRPDPVALLESQAATRVPELVPIRYGRMLVSPFTFFRGAALVMASDLSGTPRSGINAQVCGDAHLSNFGVFGSPERQLVFDCNDFDETLPGPWEWDVKRLAASIVVAARGRGFSKSVRNESILALGLAYRQSMRQMAAQSNLEVWYSHIDGRVGARPYSRNRRGRPRRRTWPHMAATVDKVVAKAHTKDSTSGARQADHGRGRCAPHRQRPAADRPDRGTLARTRERLHAREVPRVIAQVPGHAAHRPQAPARAVPGVPDRPQGGRGGQRRHPLLDHPARRDNDPRTSSSSRPRRRRPRCSSASPRRAPTTITARVSWPVSA